MLIYKIRKYWWHPVPWLIAAIITVFYLYFPKLIQWLILQPNYRHYAHYDDSVLISYVQKSLVYPFGDMLSYGPRSFLVFPYWLLIGLLLRAIYLHTGKMWRVTWGSVLFVLLVLWFSPNLLLKLESSKASLSSGKVNNGQIEYSKRMNYEGANFTTYSFLCYLAGRTYVHDKVRKTMLDAYKVCETTCLDRTFVIGEIGLKNGGRFLPHRTHQNGLSVDFMTPLLKNGQPYRSHPFWNLWGYSMEFDQMGKRGDLVIDYEAMARHLLELKRAAKENDLYTQKVIFDPVLKPFLLKTTVREAIQNLPFTKNRVTIRHDDHYHVDFGIQ